MHPPARGKCRPRRNANRARRVGIGEANAVGCEPIDVGRNGELVAIAARDVTLVLVRQQEKQIAGLHWPAPSQVSPLRLPAAGFYDKITYEAFPITLWNG